MLLCLSEFKAIYTAGVYLATTTNNGSLSQKAHEVERKGFSIVSDTLLDRLPSSFITWSNSSKPWEELDTKAWHLMDVDKQLWPYLMWGRLVLPGLSWDGLPVTVQCPTLGNSRFGEAFVFERLIESMERREVEEKKEVGQRGSWPTVIAAYCPFTEDKSTRNMIY